MRKCNVCKQLKPLAEFHKNATRPLGREYRCKECFRAWDKQRNALPERKKIRNKGNRHDPYKDKARNAVGWAIKSGRLTRLKCSRCDNTGEAHHYLGYAPEHWLDVIWLCRDHHQAKHRG